VHVEPLLDISLALAGVDRAMRRCRATRDLGHRPGDWKRLRTISPNSPAGRDDDWEFRSTLPAHLVATPKRQSRDHSAAGEYFGIGASMTDVMAPPAESPVTNILSGRFCSRESSARPSADRAGFRRDRARVFRIEPVETNHWGYSTVLGPAFMRTVCCAKRRITPMVISTGSIRKTPRAITAKPARSGRWSRRMIRDYKIDQNRIFVTGLSAVGP